LSFDECQKALDAAGQGHVLKFWEKLSAEEQKSLLEQIATLNFDDIARMASYLDDTGHIAAQADFAPAESVELAGDERLRSWERGEVLLGDGKVGVILVAGGQGSRLGYDGPKGAYAIAPLTGATLFEIHAHKVLALAERYGKPVPLYIMTSEGNDAATRQCFADNDNFDLPVEDVHFFVQGKWPALDPDGKIILEAPGQIFFSPDGHGGTLSALLNTGMIADMTSRSLSTLFYFQVDNPMVEIADPAFIGLHDLRNADISLKVCEKRDPNEGLGVVVVRDGLHGMVEYTELSDAEKQRTDVGGNLWLRYGSIAIHVFSLSFLEQEARANLPIHVAHKKVPMCDADGKTVKPDEANAYKFEKFIFDVLPHANTVVNLVCAREDEFSPVKNAEGADSPATCRADMTAKFARWLDQVGVAVPRDGDGQPSVTIEIDPMFALGPGELRQRLPEEGIVIDDDLLLGASSCEV
jgi:UDP-N-acetylglucosamine/UDP-N-acetylgalactosamine diphosphorylase